MMGVKKLKQVAYEDINETIYKSKLDNGLTIFLLPKREFFKTFGIFMTNYGSIDRSFIPIDSDEEITVPDGIAHFLEHKLFEKEEEDIFTKFLQQGASPNAFTSFTKTAYYFSTTKLVEKNVETLLNFVQEPFFSDESVEKEKGIIGQEIKMYDDQPDWRAYMGTVKNMFHHHPVNIDIAGTVSSISEITKEDLYTCYNTFYHPSNMTLFIIGNFDHEAVFEVIQQNQAKKSFKDAKEIVRFLPEEPANVFRKENTIHLPVSIPKVSIGIKEANKKLDKDTFLKREVVQSMLLDYFFSESGPFYEKLYENELIDDTFTFSTTVENSFSFSLISSNSKKPEQFSNQVKEMLLSTKEMTISEKQLDVMKKKHIGQNLRSMNSLDYIAIQYVQYHYEGIDLFKKNDFIQALSVEEINEFLQSWIEEDRLTVCKIENVN